MARRPVVPIALALVAVAVAVTAAHGHAVRGRGATSRGLWPDDLTLASTRRAAPAAARRATTWCGAPATADRPPAVTGYPIRVVYALPADATDASATEAPQISDMLDRIDAWWQREDPSRLPRFDVYAAPCGPQYDLQVIRLSSVSVATTDAHQIFDVLWSQLQSQPDAGTAKYLVFVDGVDTGDVCGVGSPASGSTLGALSMGVAMVSLDSCQGTDVASTAAHELLHAVSPADGFPTSPHICPGDAFHFCDSSGDILYPYAESGVPMTSLQLDYGHDDYWAGTAPTNLQVQPWFSHPQDQVRLALTIAGNGTVQSDVPGVDCSASCGTSWDRGTTVALSPSAAPGYRFVRWTGGCSGDADCSVALDASKTATALFAPSTFPLSVRITGSGAVTSPAGISCRRGTCTRRLSSYTPVVLTARPAKGARFVAWGGACHGTRTRCSVPMSSATAVRAAFARKS